MDHMDVLLRIERTLGNLDARASSMSEDIKEIVKEAKYTNGKVMKLRDDVDRTKQDIATLYQAVNAVPVQHDVKKGGLFTLTWERLLFIFGSVATLIAFVIEKLS